MRLAIKVQIRTSKNVKCVHMIKCVKVRTLFAKNKVRFARAEQLCFCSTQLADAPRPLSISTALHCNLLRHRPMDARKHRCRILLAASEPVAYRLV